MPLSAALNVASSSPSSRSSIYSPNTVTRLAFLDLSIEIRSRKPPPLLSPLNSASSSGRFRTFRHGSNMSKSCVQLHLQETLRHANTLPTDQLELAFHRITAAASKQNCHSFSHSKEKGLSNHQNAEPSIIFEEEKQRCDESKRVSSGFVEGNALKGLKRRRPPRLEISLSTMPEARPSLHMDNFNGETQKETYVKGCNYSVACKKGTRNVMEDAYRAIPHISGDSTQAFFGVFDGHGGREAADFAAERLGHNIVDELGKGEADMEEAVRTGYLTTDEAFSKENISSGACCVTALINEGEMVVANAGDCRAVASIDGIAEALTCDHRVEREDERQRIENLGGYVDCRNGVWRAQGVLAVSRSIGDISMKQWISAEPEMMKLNITSNCEFLILASDGLWDKVSNEEAVDMARPFWVEKNKSWVCACRKLMEVAVSRGSKDDVTVMIVDLSHFCR